MFNILWVISPLFCVLKSVCFPSDFIYDKNMEQRPTSKKEGTEGIKMTQFGGFDTHKLVEINIFLILNIFNNYKSMLI